MRVKKSVTLAEMLRAFSLTVCIFSAAVVLTLQFRWLYYMDISWLHLSDSVGLSPEMIRQNFDALIDYNMLWHQEELLFPSFPMSESGRIHFEEVKRIFDMIQIMLICSGIISLAWGIVQRKHKERRWLKISALMCLVIPCVFGVFAAVSWETLFVGFHKLMFRNDYWLFDPVTDPVIRILPDTFFLQCAVCILLLIAFGSFLCLFFSGSEKGIKHSKDRRKR